MFFFVLQLSKYSYLCIKNLHAYVTMSVVSDDVMLKKEGKNPDEESHASGKVLLDLISIPLL